MNNKYDVVIVGAGHNGLVCGAYLSKAGLRVCLVERREIIGGAAVTEEIYPGFKASTASYVMALLQPKIIMDLELKKFGFEVLAVPPAFHRMENGQSVLLWDDERRMAAEFSKISIKDGEAFIQYRNHLRTLKPHLQKLLWQIPVDITDTSLAKRLDTLKLAWKFRNIGVSFYDIYDLLTMSAYDYLSRWFESDHIKTILGFYAGCAGGHFTSPKSPGTAFVLIRPVLRDLDTPAGPAGFMKGGMGAVSQSILSSGQRYGMQVRTGGDVDSIIIKNGKATGVALATGEEINGNIVVSNTSARTTFTRLVADSQLTEKFKKDVDNIRSESSTFKLNVALDHLPDIVGFDAQAAGFSYPAQVRIAPSMDYMVKALDDTGSQHFSVNPAMLMSTPSIVDSTLAPEGKHVVNIIGSHAPYTLKGTTWDEQREPLLKTTLKTIEEFAPGFSDAIIHTEILTPLDLERRFDLPRGHIHHAEITSDQIFFKRPVPGYADYRTPIDQLYLCGASNHPGGGVTGVPGYNAASVILKDTKW